MLPSALRHDRWHRETAAVSIFYTQTARNPSRLRSAARGDLEFIHWVFALTLAEVNSHGGQHLVGLRLTGTPAQVYQLKHGPVPFPS